MNGARPFDFDTIAAEYDRFYDTRLGQEIDRVEKRLVGSLLRTVPPGPLLEIGCGTGHWTHFFVARGFSVTAVDRAPQMLRVARGRQLSGVSWQRHDAHSLGLADAALPCVAAITVLEFVEDQGRVLSEIHRVLAPGGHLLLGCLNLDSSLGRSKDESEIYRNARFFTPESLESALMRFGRPRVSGCVLLQGERVLDLQPGDGGDEGDRHGAFLVGCVNKEA